MIASMFKRFGLAVAFAATVSAAQATPLLKGDIIVTSSIVTIGDMFENAGLIAETAIFRAPAPGTTGVLSIEEVAQAARAAGLDDFESAGLDRIRVARVGVMIDMPLITDLIAGDLRNRGILNDSMSMQIALDAPLPMLTAADTASPATLVILRYMPGSASFSARFQIAGRETPLDVAGQIQLMIEAPHLARTLPAGAILRTDDIELRMVPLNYAETSGLVRIEDVVGKQLQRQTRAGVLLRPADVASPELISRNEIVTIIYRQGALTLTTRGQALNAASLDQPVSVLNPMTRKVLHGIATANSTVTISSGPQQVAGL